MTTDKPYPCSDGDDNTSEESDGPEALLQLVSSSLST